MVVDTVPMGGDAAAASTVGAMVDGGHPRQRCVLQVKVLPETDSGEHKFKVRFHPSSTLIQPHSQS